MSTNELENKLKIIKDAGIHCPTLELAKQVLNIFNDLGLKWCSEVYYTKCTNWDSYKENTIYYPFEGRFSSLAHAQQNNYKIISAEKFIALHTEDFDLETYEPKGELEGFPKEIIAKMLDYQQEQNTKRDVSVFEKNIIAGKNPKGFSWFFTKEGIDFWNEVISNKDFNLFFEKYPKKEDTSQEFKVGDKVIDIIMGRIGKVIGIDTLLKIKYPIFVEFDDNETRRFTLDGKYYGIDKYPRLLHYRDDYDYSVINFNNLPKKEEVKRWRAEKGGIYYFIKRDDYNSELDRVCETKDYYSYISNEQYKIGNYFQIKEQAQKIVDQTNTYFQKIVKI